MESILNCFDCVVSCSSCKGLCPNDKEGAQLPPEMALVKKYRLLYEQFYKMPPPFFEVKGHIVKVIPIGLFGEFGMNPIQPFDVTIHDLKSATNLLEDWLTMGREEAGF